MKRLSTEEITNEVKTSLQRIAELKEQINAFSSKLEHFSEAWESSNGETVKGDVAAIVNDLKAAEASFNNVLEKISKTKSSIEQVNAGHFTA